MDGYWEFKPKLIAAGALGVKEAGGDIIPSGKRNL